MALCAIPHLLVASTFTAYSFIPYPQGEYPSSALLLASDGNYYGTTRSGGSSNDGTLFRLTLAGNLTTLINFNGANGYAPASSLIQGKDGCLYGTTSGGGAGGLGTIFKLNPTGSGFTLTTLFIFTNAVGNSPTSLIQARDGNFYGTTSGGGAGQGGIIFELIPGPSGFTFTTLASFNSNNGYAPQGLIQGSDNNFYGSAFGGGPSGGGTVFQLVPNGDSFTLNTLVSFGQFESSNGSGPSGGPIQGMDGSFYGSTEAGGPGNVGTIYKLTPNGNSFTLTTLANFNQANGSGPQGALLEDSTGNFYGVTQSGTSSTAGTIFKLAPGDSGYSLTTLANLSNENSDGTSALIFGKDGSLYGASFQYGARNSGTIFKVTTSGTLTTVYSFPVNPSSNPECLIKGADGNFYGTTSVGDQDNSIFKMTPDGTLSTFVSLDANNLSYVNAELIQGTDGNFYGTTNDEDGSNGNGKIFQTTSTGTVTTLFSFNHANGSVPVADLVQAKDSSFYGTTEYGGSSGYGTAFKITSTGTFTSLASFASTTFPGSPAQISGALLQDTDGNLYGTTHGGNGVVFKMTLDGTVSTVFSFTGTNGSNPGGLMKGSDSNFYFTGQGPYTSSNSVSIYQFIPVSGMVSPLANASDDGGYGAVYSPLVQDKAGNFYGTTQAGGDPSANAGTLFVATPSGTLTTLVEFEGYNGQSPQSAMVLGNDGNLYGVASGGSANAGVVFCLNPTSTDQVTFTSTATVPISSSSYTINGSALNLTLNYAPSPGDVLTVVHNTGATPISGTFTNLPNGGTISATYNGTTYTFTANYSGGSGNDLTLTLPASAAPTDTPLLPTWALLALTAALFAAGSQLSRHPTAS